MPISHVDGKVIPPKPQHAPLPPPHIAMALAEARSRVSRQQYLRKKGLTK